MIKRFIEKLAKPVTKTRRKTIGPDQHSVRVNDMSAFGVEVADQLRDANYDAYLVGGCVRDALLNKRPKDFDVATDARPEQVKRLFRRARIIGRRFQIVHVQNRQEIIEVTTFRGDHTQAPKESKRPKRGEQSARSSGKGVLLRDNVFGSLEEDALRRDFTCNALYFDADTEDIIDFVGGVADLQQGLLRTIGQPEQRFREDPVRMMRAIRFQSKLDLKLDKASALALNSQAKMITEVSPARLFDEVIKLLLHEKSVSAFQQFTDSKIFEYLFPVSASVVSAEPRYAKMLQIAMNNTEQRLGVGKTVSPFYLYATLLWPMVDVEYQRQLSNKQAPARAMETAISQALAIQSETVSIPKRFSQSMRDTWHLQTQLHRRSGDRAERLVSNPRFRAAYDFLLMREEAGENHDRLGEWWTNYQNANAEKRALMVESLGAPLRKPRRRRRRTNKPSNAE